MARRYFGSIRKLPSGRFQASYKGPDGRRHPAPSTFDSRQYAGRYLARVSAAIQEDRWVSPDAAKYAPKVPLFGEYAAAYARGGINVLADTVRAEQQAAPERLFVRVVDRGVEAVVLSSPNGF